MNFHPKLKYSISLVLVGLLLLTGVMNTFAANSPAMTAPVLLSPSGMITVDKPVFTWRSVPGAASYLVLLYNGADNLVNTWFSAADLACNEKTCKLNMTDALPMGEYRWWIKARDAAALEGPWSSGMVFSTGNKALPAAPVLIAPSGNIPTNNPTYQWRRSPDAREYLFLLFDGTDNLENNWLPEEKVTCDELVCAYQSDVRIPAGKEMSWWVMPRNERGSGPWSLGAIFRGSALGVVTRTSPNAAIDPSMPVTFTWADTPAATGFDFYVNAPGDVKKFEKRYTRDEARCDGTSCSVIVNDVLADGTYYWWVRAVNDFSQGDWFDPVSTLPADEQHGPWFTGMRFTVGPAPELAALTIEQPTGGAATTDLHPLLSWTRDAGVAAYQVTVKEKAGGTVVFSNWFEAAAVCPTDAGCNYTLTEPLSAATAYTWSVRGMTRDGLLPFAPEAEFVTP